jgi:hypothetical protein
MAKYRFVVMHVKCDKPAFLYSEYPPFGAVLESAKALLLDGSKPDRLAESRCGSCGLPVLEHEIKRSFIIQRRWLRKDYEKKLPVDNEQPEGEDK